MPGNQTPPMPKRTMSIEPDVFRAAIAVLKTDASPVTDSNAADAVVSLLREAMDYTTDWRNSRESYRGAPPSTIYRKEFALASSIVIAGRLVKA